ncbi:hypothetical protein SZ64_08775 [Erythrobacter sp. SG61-1L]|uniref:hypothetical protein n=1 Tax=Erythrobacter sp. SG61-1L TaxID=1603897 RepID=UPI0006C906D1|nr:hypothetical protein [Erythrobacter sp. SG61-1L]KPL68207.1 hypothetical protein SZ64_08775 [Erythrobacter sp. SG61-1L]
MEEDFLSRARSRSPERRGSGLLIGAVLASFLVGVAGTGYIAWKGGLDFLPGTGEAVQETPAPLDRQPLLASEPSPSASASESKAAAQAVEKVEQVAQQQGGIEARVVAMEQRLDQLSLQAQSVAGNAARSEALLVAFASRRSIERGQPLGSLADQLKLRFGDAHPNAVRTVIEAAKSPVTLDQLVARLDGLAPELTTSSSPELSWGRLKREFAELFVIRHEATPSPQPVKRMERAHLFMESGRVAAAAAEVSNLPGADSPDALRWIADARRYAAAQDALDRLETAAISDEVRLRDGQGRLVQQRSPIQP